MIQTDLVRAGIPLDIPGEGKIDFHSLRVTFCTLLDDQGASAKTTQELARHSTPVITMNTYVRTSVNRLRNAVDAVGDIVHPKPVPELCPNGAEPQLRILSNAG
jgi:integrase